MEQVLVSEQDAVTLYKLNNLLKFYHHTIGKVLVSEQDDVTLYKLNNLLKFYHHTIG